MGNESEGRLGCSEKPVSAGYHLGGIWGPTALWVSVKSQPKAVANILLQVYMLIVKILNKISFPLTLCWVPARAFACGHCWSLLSAGKALICVARVSLIMPERCYSLIASCYWYWAAALWNVRCKMYLGFLILYISVMHCQLLPSVIHHIKKWHKYYLYMTVTLLNYLQRFNRWWMSPWGTGVTSEYSHASNK